MAHNNDLYFVQRHYGLLKGRLLEVGSKQYESGYIRWKDAFPDHVGMDMQAGEGVDIVHNLESGAYPEMYDSILCLSVLEHTRKPWVVAENLMAMLKPGGHIVVGTPWIWRTHNYPGDYFRISVTGIQSLFDGLEWVDTAYCSTVDGEFLSDEKWRGGFMVKMGGQSRSGAIYEYAYALGRKP